MSIAVVSLVLGLISELGRQSFKGPGYQYLSFNDAFFYRAMAVNLGHGPVSVVQEISSLGLRISSSEFHAFYGGEGFWATHVHAENGLSHQPPWSYRWLPSALVGVLFRLGIPIDLGFLSGFLAGLVLFACCLFSYLQSSTGKSSVAWVVSLSACVATVAFTSPGYPDMPFLGLSMWAVLAAYKRKTLIFVLASVCAGFTRETGVLLAIPWLAAIWVHKDTRAWKFLPAIAPLLSVGIVRLVESAPNSSVDYLAMLRLSWGGAWPYLLATIAILTAGLVSPLPIRTIVKGASDRQWKADLGMWAAGVVWVFVSDAFGLAYTRMLLLALPIMLAPSGWRGATPRYWLVASSVALLGYAAADTLAFRADPPFGQWPWLIVAGVVVGLQILGCRCFTRTRNPVKEI